VVGFGRAAVIFLKYLKACYTSHVGIEFKSAIRNKLTGWQSEVEEKIHPIRFPIETRKHS